MESSKKHKIVIAEPERFSNNALNKLKEIGNVVQGPYCSQEFINVCENATIIVLRLQHYLNASFFENAKNLKYILTPTTGLNHIDQKAAIKNRVKIISLKNEVAFLSSIPSTAEFTWGLLLSLIRQIPSANEHVLQGGWDRNKFVSRNLNTLTLGILGFGRVGKQVSRYAQAFDMPFLSYDIDPAKKQFTHSVAELKDFLSQIDVLSIHIPLNSKNILFLNKDNLSFLKKEAYIINTSRGEVIDENIVVSMLRANKLMGIATDVLANEFHPKKRNDNCLLTYAKENENCIITPHIAGATIDSMQMTEDFVVDKLIQEWK